MKHALHAEQRLDALDYINAAITDTRAVIEICPGCGPVLIGAYKCLSALGELREVIDALPVIEREPGP